MKEIMNIYLQYATLGVGQFFGVAFLTAIFVNGIVNIFSLLVTLIRGYNPNILTGEKEKNGKTEDSRNKGEDKF